MYSDNKLSAKAHFIAVLLIGGFSTFILSYLSLPSWITLSIPTATIIYYAFYSYKLDSLERDIDGLNHHAEQIYLLGYLLTLFAIFGVALTPQGEINELIKAAAVKLLASLSGITAMLILKEISHGWEQDQTSKQELFEHDIGRRISNFQVALDSLGERIMYIEKVINFEFIDETAKIIKNFRTTLEVSSKEVGMTITKLSNVGKQQQQDLSALAQNFTQAQKDFLRSHAETLETFNNDIFNKLSSYNSSHDDLIDAMHQRGNELAAELKKQFDEIARHTQLAAEHSLSFSESIKTASEASNSLKESIDALDAQRANQSISELGNAINQIAERFKVLEDYDERLKEATALQTKLHEEYIHNLQELVPNTREHQTQIAQLALEAQNQLETFRNVLNPEAMKLKDTADHVIAMSYSMNEVLSKMQSTATDIKDAHAVSEEKEPKKGFPFFR